jgi:hypothetical protein
MFTAMAADFAFAMHLLSAILRRCLRPRGFDRTRAAFRPVTCGGCGRR